MAKGALASSVDNDYSDDKTELLQDYILDHLGFRSMTERQSEVAEAHGESFEWIFQQSQPPHGDQDKAQARPGSDFLRWLSDEQQGLYWISGKAGSGKSTLMRFLSDHPTTQKALRAWAGTLPLSTAGFFFWTSGSIEQRSQAGLLRSLLWQLLQQHRSLIKHVFPALWAQCWIMSTKDRIRMTPEWPLDQLMLGLRLYVKHIVGKVKACLLIDGLDEFEGDHAIIIELFKGLQKESAGHLKVCLSSRPWPVFEENFRNVPQFKLQDLTQHDMFNYVNDKFKQNEKMRQITSQDPKVEKALVMEIVGKADGVFLWVIMIVGALLDDIAAQDQLEDMQKRLRVFPTDLDELFRHVLFERLPTSDLECATRYFQLIRAREIVCEYTGDQSNGTLKLWEVALADNATTEDVINTPIHQLPQPEILERCKATRENITHRSAGLLEVHKRGGRDAEAAQRFATDETAVRVESIAYGRVSFLHRTVRDFLIYSGVWPRIVSVTASQHFDPHLAHLQSYILQLKLPFVRPKLHRRIDEWWSGIVLAMTHARYCTTTTDTDTNALADQVVPLLDELNITLSSLWQSRTFLEPDDNWAKHAFGTYESRRGHTFHDPFLSLTTKFGLTHYIEAKLRTGQYHYEGGQPLLAHAVEYLVSRQNSVYPLASAGMVRVLFKQGEGAGAPNVRYRDLVTGKDETPWTKCLGALQQADRRGWIAAASMPIESSSSSSPDNDVGNDNDGPHMRRRQTSPGWIDILRLFLEHGANPNAVSTGWAKDPSLPALEIVEGLAKKYPEIAEALEGLCDVLAARGAHRAP